MATDQAGKTLHILDIESGLRVDVERTDLVKSGNVNAGTIYLVGGDGRIYAQAGGNAESHGEFERGRGYLWGSVEPVKEGQVFSREIWDINPETFIAKPRVGYTPIIVEDRDSRISHMLEFHRRIRNVRGMYEKEKEQCRRFLD